MAVTSRVESWRWRGTDVRFLGRSIHQRLAGGSAGPLILLLHGFPSSSYDWRFLLDGELRQRALAFDFLGFGLSDKPRSHGYSLLWQADLAEELVRRHAPEQKVFILAHDMGTSVANELMARDLDGKLSFDLQGVLLMNGSMVQTAASPTLGQRLLRGRFGPVASQLSSERFFRNQFGSIFSPGHPLTEEEAEDQWSLIRFNGGHRIGHRTIGYMDEREARAARWHGAIKKWRPKGLSKRRKWPGLEFAWGMLDPVATPNVLDALRELRPDAPVTEWDDLGHYPQLEDPERVSEVLQAAVKQVK